METVLDVLIFIFQVMLGMGIAITCMAVGEFTGRALARFLVRKGWIKW